MTSFYYYDQNPSAFCKWRLYSLCKDAPYDGFCYLNLAGISKFKYERKNEKDSGRNTVEPRLTMMVALKELHSVVKRCHCSSGQFQNQTESGKEHFDDVK